MLRFSRILPRSWSRQIKYRFLSHLNGVFYVGSTSFVALLLFFANHSLFDDLLTNAHITPEKASYAIILNVIAAIAVGVFAKKVKIVSWSRKKLDPVNTDITPHLEVYRSYYRAASERIRRLLPEELTDVWTAGHASASPLISVHAREDFSPSRERRRRHHISALDDFLDVTFLLHGDQINRPLVIQGEPGSGKSVFLFELFRRRASILFKDGQGWIPVFVFAHELTLDFLKPHRTLRDFLVSYFRRSAVEYDSPGYQSIAQFIHDSYDLFQFLIIIDGLDEITDRTRYREVVGKLDHLLEDDNFSNRPNRYIVSCRRDDNLDLINGSLVTLLPLRPRDVSGYIKALGGFYKGRLESARDNAPDQARKAAEQLKRLKNAKEGLAKSQKQQLLQNYLSNPHLLFVIVKYYSDSEDSYADTLRVVFRDVLAREAEKPWAAFAKNQTVNQAEAGKYLSTLLAPYCFFRTFFQFQGEALPEPEFDRFLRYICADQKLGELLFGKVGTMGYVDAFLPPGVPEVREELFYRLLEIWGERATRRLRDFLAGYVEAFVPLGNPEAQDKLFGGLAIVWGPRWTDRLRESLEQVAPSPVPQIDIGRAAGQYLYHDVLWMLEKSTIAEIDQSTQSIKRFRHRRMQDYFAALFIETAEIVEKDPGSLHLANAWVREPLRVYAATSKTPSGLFSAFNEYLDGDRRPDTGDTTGDLNKLADTLMNASAAASYLPADKGNTSAPELFDNVIRLATLALTRYHDSELRTEDGPVMDARTWLSLREKWLTILGDIYASEFVRFRNRSNRRSLFAPHAAIWRHVNQTVEFGDEFYQDVAYLHFYPIRARHSSFPISRSSLFSHVLDSAFFFADEYDGLIQPTHPTIVSRIGPAVAAGVVRLLSAGLIGLVVVALWQPGDPVELQIIRPVTVISGLILLGFVIQISGWMPFRDSYKFVLWCLAKLWKWIYPRIKFLVYCICRGVATVVGGIWRAIPKGALAFAARLGRFLVFLGHGVPKLLAGLIGALAALARFLPRIPALTWWLLTRLAIGLWTGVSATSRFVAAIPKHTLLILTWVFGKLCLIVDFFRQPRAAPKRSVESSETSPGGSREPERPPGPRPPPRQFRWRGKRIAAVAILLAACITTYQLRLVQKAAELPTRIAVHNFLTRSQNQEKSYTALVSQTQFDLRFGGIDENKLVAVQKEIGSADEGVQALTTQGQALLRSNLSGEDQRDVSNILEDLQKAGTQLADLEGLVVKERQRRADSQAAEVVRKAAIGLRQALDAADVALREGDSVDELKDKSKRIGDWVSQYDALQNQWVSLAARSGPYGDVKSVMDGLAGSMALLKERKRLLDEAIRQRSVIATPGPTNPGVGAEQEARARLEQQCAEIFNGYQYQNILGQKREFESVSAKNESDLTGAVAEAKTPADDVRWWALIFERLTLSGKIDALDRINQSNVGLTLTATQLADLTGRVQAVLDQLRSSESGPFCQDAKKRLADLQGYAAALKDYRIKIDAVDLRGLSEKLRIKQNGVAERTQVQYKALFYGFIFLLVSFAGLKLWKVFGDERGDRETERLKADFYGNLDFIKTNSFSIDVNERAIYYLKKAIPEYNATILKLLSDAAAYRAGRFGSIHKRVAALLRQVATGVDAVVNREEGLQPRT